MSRHDLHSSVSLIQIGASLVGNSQDQPRTWMAFVLRLECREVSSHLVGVKHTKNELSSAQNPFRHAPRASFDSLLVEIISIIFVDYLERDTCFGPRTGRGWVPPLQALHHAEGTRGLSVARTVRVRYHAFASSFARFSTSAGRFSP